jgi:hypothetical protein
MVYSGRMTRGETLEMNASRNSIRVAGQPVTDVKLRDLNEYQVWYHKQPPAPTVSTAGATASAAPTVSTAGATAAAAPTVSTAGATAAAPPPPPPSSPPATLTQIKDELTQARAQVETTTASMNTLSQSGGADVANNYDKFATEVAKLQRDVETCRARADDLKGRAQAYFDTWNRQAEVQNPDLRRSAIAQRAEAERTFATIKSEMELTKLSLDPYMKHLTDISSYLKINKSPAALATVQDAVAAAAGDGTEVGKHVDAVLAGIDKVMAASGEATPAAAPAAK